jgi:hypothetical protein
VTVSTSGSALAQLVKKLGAEQLLRCLEMGPLELSYSPTMLGLRGGDESHLFSPVIISLVPKKNQTKRPTNTQTSMQDDVEERFGRVLGRTTDISHQAQAF